MPISFLYLFVITLKRCFSKKRKYKFFIISVGNIITGGTGKTLFVSEIIKKVISLNYKIAVVSSIFKKGKGESIPYDEVIMIKNNFPSIIISGDKTPSGLEKLEEMGIEIVVIDDGFHCQWVEKDVDILMFDSSNPFDNKLLIPSGLLREPVSSIKRADVFIISYPHLVGEKEKYTLLTFLQKQEKPIFFLKIKPVYLSNGKEKVLLEEVKGKKILCFAGIGNPFNFFLTTSQLKPEKQYSVAFPDHFNYKEKDIHKIIDFFKKENIDFIITTEKDYVKVQKFIKGNIPFYFLKIEGEIEDKNNFDKLLFDKLKYKDIYSLNHTDLK